MNKRKLACILSLSLTALGLSACSSYDGSTGNGLPVSHYNEKTSLEHVDISTNLVELSKHTPINLSVGQEYQSTIVVRALKPIAGAVVTDTIPSNVRVVKTEPKAIVDGNKLTWHLGDMNRGEITNINVWLRATDEGEATTCSTIDATPRTCHAITVGKPQLVIEKNGPTRVRMGDSFDYTISVKNTGNQVAHNVIVHDVMPEALGASKDFTIGDMAPGGVSQQMVVHAKGSQRGNFCNNAEVDADNHGPIDAKACTLVYQEMIAIDKTGDEQQRIGKTASYKVNVNNSGDTTQNNIVVRDNAPNGTRITSAPGATISGNTATWNIATLEAGRSESFNLNLVSNTAGQLCNSASVTAGGSSDEASTCTKWIGVPALGVEMIDTRDSLLVGETTEYHLKVKNQGTGDDSNLGVTVTFPASIKPVSIGSGQTGTVSNDHVTFATHQVFTAGEVVEYTINAKAVKVGSDIIEATVKTSTLGPVVEQERTNVY